MPAICSSLFSSPLPQLINCSELYIYSNYHYPRVLCPPSSLSVHGGSA